MRTITSKLLLILLLAAGCYGGKELPPDAGVPAVDAGPPLAGQGVAVLPNGAQGIAVVHFEDADGALLSPPRTANLSAPGVVAQLTEPPDFSQGIAADGFGLQTLNTAHTAPALADQVPVSEHGEVLSMAVLPGTSFAVVQLSGLVDYAVTCFTTGLHLAQGQQLTPGQPVAKAFSASPDGTLLLGWENAGQLQLYSVVSTTEGAHSISITPRASLAAPAPPSVTGRGAMAWHPTLDTALVGGADGSLTALTVARTQPALHTLQLPGGPAVASVAWAPGGGFAVAATSAGLFTIVLVGGAPAVLAGPVDPTFAGADGQSYHLARAQSVAGSADGRYLFALVDRPSPSAGTLVALPLDAEGAVGPVGSSLGGVLANPGADVLFAH